MAVHEDPTTESLNDRLERLNRLVEEQRARLESLVQAAEALRERVRREGLGIRRGIAPHPPDHHARDDNR